VIGNIYLKDNPKTIYHIHMGKSKGIMVIGKKRRHVGGWVGRETKVKKQKK
jgi:hypothetical protein